MKLTFVADEPLRKFLEQKAAQEDRSLSAVVRRIVAEAAKQSQQQKQVAA